MTPDAVFLEMMCVCLAFAFVAGVTFVACLVWYLARRSQAVQADAQKTVTESKALVQKFLEGHNAHSTQLAQHHAALEELGRQVQAIRMKDLTHKRTHGIG